MSDNILGNTAVQSQTEAHTIGDSASPYAEPTSAAPVIRGNSLYTLVDGPSWTEAEANAQKVGGHLATVSSSSENDFLFNTFGPSNTPDQEKWIGLNDSKVEGVWEWSSGEPVNYTNWASVAPANNVSIVYPDGKGKETQDYVNYWWGTNNGSWDDYFNEGNGGNSKGIAETPIVTRGDSAYAIVHGPSWEEAEANAQKLGGHLVTINDAAEKDYLYNNFGNILPAYSGTSSPAGALWTGLTDRETEGTYKWSSGDTSTWFESTYKGSGGWIPNGDSFSQDYIVLRKNGDNPAGYDFDDYWSSNQSWSGTSVTAGIAEIKLTGTTPPADDGKPPAAPTLSTVAASASDTASASGLEALILDVGAAANVQAPVTLKSTSDASTVEGNVKSDAHATEVLGISASTLHSASDLSVGSALQSIVSGSAESTSGIAIANALVDTQHGIDLNNPIGGDALASGGSSTVVSTSSLTATSTAQTVGDGISDSGARHLDGAWANTIAKDHLGLGSTGILTLDSESNATVSTSMLSKLTSTATANDGLAVASSQLLSSTGIENLTAEVGGLGLVTAINQGVFKADANSTTDDASALGINKASAGILDSTFSFGVTDSTITAKDFNTAQISATSTGGDAWSKLQSSSIGLADLTGTHSITDAGAISAIASDQGFAHSATVSGSSTAFASQEAIGMSGYEVHNLSGLNLSAQALVSSEANSSAVGGIGQ